MPEKPPGLPAMAPETTAVPARSASVHYPLGALLAFVAPNAFGGGLYGLAGAEGVPTEWLAGSPFNYYVVPSLYLLVVVGGTFLAAAVAAFARARPARHLALDTGVLVLAWMAVPVAFIGYVSWMQPGTTVAGISSSSP